MPTPRPSAAPSRTVDACHTASLPSHRSLLHASDTQVSNAPPFAQLWQAPFWRNVSWRSVRGPFHSQRPDRSCCTLQPTMLTAAVPFVQHAHDAERRGSLLEDPARTWTARCTLAAGQTLTRTNPCGQPAASSDLQNALQTADKRTASRLRMLTNARIAFRRSSRHDVKSFLGRSASESIDA